MPMRPWRRHPTLASQVRSDATGHRSDGGTVERRHPVNHAADDLGSTPRVAFKCFRQFWST
jgi:hypothetical protein